VLEISSLNVAYGRVQVLFDVDIEVGRGELVTVIGANGAGKTTLLLTVSGVLKPQSGRIAFDGAQIDNLRPHEIVGMGLGHVPQGKELFPAMTVLENLEMGAHLVKDQDEYRGRLERAFELFPRLSERARQRATARVLPRPSARWPLTTTRAIGEERTSASRFSTGPAIESSQRFGRASPVEAAKGR